MKRTAKSSLISFSFSYLTSFLASTVFLASTLIANPAVALTSETRDIDQNSAEHRIQPEDFFFNRGAAYPKMPDPSLTPGKLCDRPTTKRYPEGIAYCERSVDREEKQIVIKNYDVKLGYRIGSMERSLFKIDHFIPLCAGGSNDPSNLWPQHVSVFELTDPLEQLVCEKMAQGSLLQHDAVDYIRRAKTHLEEVSGIIAEVRKL